MSISVPLKYHVMRGRGFPDILHRNFAFSFTSTVVTRPCFTLMPSDGGPMNRNKISVNIYTLYHLRYNQEFNTKTILCSVKKFEVKGCTSAIVFRQIG